MGFSVSGSAAIIFLAAFVGFGVLYTSAYNSFELIDTAADDREADLLGQQNTDIEVVAAEAFSGNDTVRVTVANTGATELGVNETDLLLNGTYQANPSTSVEGASDSSLWLPGENLTMETTYSVSGTIRIKVVTEHGIAAFEEVNG
jgi:flagellar protein FlaF